MPALHRPSCLSASSAWRSSTIAVQGALRTPNGRIPQDRADACRARRRRRRPRLASSSRVNVAGSSSGVSPYSTSTSPFGADGRGRPSGHGRCRAAAPGTRSSPAGPRSTSAATSAMSGASTTTVRPGCRPRPGQHVLDHRASGQPVQHLRPRRFHPRPFAGGEDHHGNRRTHDQRTLANQPLNGQSQA